MFVLAVESELETSSRAVGRIERGGVEKRYGLESAELLVR